MRMQRLEPPPQFCLEEKHSSAVVKVHSSLKLETYSEALEMTSFYFFWKKKIRAVSVDIKTRQFIIKYFRRKLSPDSLTQIILLKYYFTFIETSVSTGNDRILISQILLVAFSLRHFFQVKHCICFKILGNICVRDKIIYSY